MLLSKKKRQEYLKYLGYYDGKIDGIVGAKTKEAYRKLQNDYFFRSKDKDELYGKNTDTLLRNAYAVKKYTKNFDLKNELACRCHGKYCTGYPSVLDENLLIYLQEVRNEYGSTSVTSCLRCKTWNNLQGGVRSSRHKRGKAVDIRNSKICKSNETKKDFIDKYITKDKANYSYTYGYGRTKRYTTYPKTTSMRTSVHIDVK